MEAVRRCTTSKPLLYRVALYVNLHVTDLLSLSSSSESVCPGAIPASAPFSEDHTPPKLNVGDEVKLGSHPMSVSTSAFECNGSQVGIDDFGKLTLSQPPPRHALLDPPSDAPSMPNPLKRGPTENLESSQLDSKSQSIGYTASARRRGKARPSGSFVAILRPEHAHTERFVPDDRSTSRNFHSPTKGLYNPYVDDKASDLAGTLPNNRPRGTQSDQMVPDEKDSATKPSGSKQLAIGRVASSFEVCHNIDYLLPIS